MTKRSRKVEHDDAGSEGTATAAGWLAVAMARLCNEVCGPRDIRIRQPRLNAKLYQGSAGLLIFLLFKSK